MDQSTLKRLQRKFQKNSIYSCTFFLFVFWIVISIVKFVCNYDGISNYNFIQRNTIGGYLLVFISLSLSKCLFKKLVYALPIFFVILIFHECLWYKAFIQITKDEGEVTENCYFWMNTYVTAITTSTDLSESLFDNNWDISNEESYKIKFETYFDYLKLEPGMKLLDIGCGNCQWLQYCKSRGVYGIGLTISRSQQEFCNDMGIPKIIVGDINKRVLTTLNETFDAVSAIGPVEHFSSVSQTPKQRQDILSKFYDEVRTVINTDSKSARYLNSYMTSNLQYSKFNFEYWAQAYLIASTFGYGFYNSDEKMSQIYSRGNSTIVIKRDYTEDYRWNLAREPTSWGRVGYNFETTYRFLNFVRDVFIDPSWWQRFLYGYYKTWLWQFGGAMEYPIPHITDTPIRSYIYVTQLGPEDNTNSEDVNVAHVDASWWEINFYTLATSILLVLVVKFFSGSKHAVIASISSMCCKKEKLANEMKNGRVMPNKLTKDSVQAEY